MTRSSFTAFLIVVSFGILFAGCSLAPEPEKSFEEFTFTEEDLTKVQRLFTGTGGTQESGSGSSVAAISLGSGTSLMNADSTDALRNTSKAKLYASIRVSTAGKTESIYKVNNPYLNVRTKMEVNSSLVARLSQGESLTVLDIPNAEWAKVRLIDGSEGYVAFRYLAKLTTEDRFSEEKKAYEGKYYVDYAFLNLRKEPSTTAEKVGELPGQAILKPLSMNREWARVAYNGKEGYVSTQYLKPFQPTFLVRQESYSVPILQYQMTSGSIEHLKTVLTSLKASGRKLVPLGTIYTAVLSQETRDVRIVPDSTVLTIVGVTAKNIQQLTDLLQKEGVAATFFVETEEIGMSGITERVILNVLANGNEVQSAGHTGDDLRSLTDTQVLLELGQSKKVIESLTKREVYAVAYPLGGVNDRVMTRAEEIGYLFGLTQVPDRVFSRAQFLRLPTIYVTGSANPADISQSVK